MFFKATLVLYLAAIALAAPALINVGNVGKLRMNSCPSMSCTSLSNVGVDGNDIIKDVANDARGLVGVRDVGKMRANPCPSMSCTSSSNVGVDDNNIIKDVANHAHVI